MKKSLTRKLFLSVATLALTVTCLSTTSYAWFTANETATAEAVELTTMGAADNSLYISNDGITFTASVKPIKDATANGGTLNALALTDPTVATYVPTFSTIDPATGKQNPVNASPAYLKYSLWFKTTATTSSKVNVATITIINTTETIKPWIPLANIQTGGTITAGVAQYLDVTNAARIGISMYDAYDVTGICPATPSAFARYTCPTAGSYVDTTIGTGEGKHATEAAYGLADQADNISVAYYNAVTGSTISIPADYEAGTIAPLAANDPVTQAFTEGQIVKADFYIWLEGWDADCLDGILNQKFSVAMTFTAENA